MVITWFKPRTFALLETVFTFLEREGDIRVLVATAQVLLLPMFAICVMVSLSESTLTRWPFVRRKVRFADI
jgi:hypothetical protein